MRIPTNKNFGITFGIIFILVSIILFIYDIPYFYTLCIGIIFLLLGFINSNLLFPLNFLWFKFGIILSKLISPLILFILFYFIITPYALIAKLFKKELREIKGKKKELHVDSFWNNSQNHDQINFDKQY